MSNYYFNLYYFYFFNVQFLLGLERERADMATETESLDILEERVKRLEEKIFGPLPKDAEYPEVRVMHGYGLKRLGRGSFP